MVIKKTMTRKFIEEAFSGESQAHMRYLIFADVADKEGFSNVARLFRAISFAEFVHAKNHYNALGNVGNTVENLQVAIDGETYEVEEMYPVFNNTAKSQEEKEAERSTYYALSAEKIHVELYRRAKEIVENGNDIEIGSVYICPICGYTSVEALPDTCPVCGIKGDVFIKF